MEELFLNTIQFFNDNRCWIFPPMLVLISYILIKEIKGFKKRGIRPNVRR